jgi:hypothetical protein
MHDHVNAPVEETPLLLKAADPMRAEVVTPTAFVLRWRKSKEKAIQDHRIRLSRDNLLD